MRRDTVWSVERNPPSRGRRKLMNTFSRHIPFAELADLADEKSPAPAAALQHLAACSRCSQELQTIRQTTSLMRTDSTEDTPAQLVQHARQLFRGRTAKQKPSALKRVLASLTFDSLTMAPAFGLRSQTSGERQLVYSTEDADIDLRVSLENEEWQITGQVPGSIGEGGEISLEGGSFSATQALNELCEFAFSAVPSGAYKLSVHLPGAVIETPQFELGP